MKKNNYVQQLRADNPVFIVWKKIPLSMKLLFVFCFCFVGLLCANDSYAQRTMISVKAQNLTVKEVLSQIEAQSDFSFFYNDHHIDVDRRVSVVTERSNIFTLLNEVFKNTNVKYAVRNKKIILSTQIVEAPAAKQTVQIKGKVTDMFGDPVIGATVMEDGTQNGTITDLDGNFILNTASANVTITVSYVGYMPQTVKAQSGKSLSVILKEDTKTLDEIVVVGFGTQKKVNLTGSVSTVNAEDLLSRPVSNVSQALQGLVPGMNFSYASDGNGGEIGADMKVNIRGAGTIGDGSNASPLILIDGMEGNMNMLNPNDIESISVLKDAAASSIYGSRAPFGVVLITTKKGKAGKVNINYNNSFRWSEAINLPDVADAYTYAMYFNKMQLNDGKTAVQFDDTRLQAIKDYASGTITTTTQPNRNTPTIWDWIGNTNTDWYDVVFGGTAFSQEHSLSVSGGTEKIQYYFSGNYMGQEGMMAIRRDKLQRYSVSSKINAQLYPWLNMNYSMKYMRKDYSKPTAMTDNTLYQNIAKRWPMEPTVDPNGYPMGNTIIRPILYGGDNNSQTDWLYQQFQVVIEPIKDWKIFGEINYKVIDAFTHTDYLKVPQMNVAGEPYSGDTWKTSKVTEGAERTNYFNANVYSEYYRSFADAHHLKAMVGFQAEVNKWRQLQASKLDLISESVPSINAATGESTIDKSKLTHWATAGFFGRLNYDYKERYLLEVNLRYDGTSRFAKDKRWNLFPSFSAGWIATAEKFMENQKIVDYLKLRASWGRVGNDKGVDSRFMYMPAVWGSSGSYSFGVDNPISQSAAAISRMGNPAVTWETADKQNYGIDLKFFNSRLSATFDYFIEHRTGILISPESTPSIIATALPNLNIGKVDNHGYEVSLGWRDKIGKDFTYNVDANVSFARNKILYMDEVPKQFSYMNQTGGSTGRQTGVYNYIRLYQYSDFITGADGELTLKPELPQPYQKVYPGDAMYADLNGDHIVDGNDKSVAGYATRPEYVFGMNMGFDWKGFNFTMQWVGSKNVNRMYDIEYRIPYTNAGKRGLLTYFYDGCWTPENQLGATYPRPSEESESWNSEPSTLWLVDASYLRLKSLSFGYTITGKKFLKKLGLSSLGLNFSGYNLLTFSPLKYLDPESDPNRFGDYPLIKVYSFGLNLNF